MDGKEGPAYPPQKRPRLDLSWSVREATVGGEHSRDRRWYTRMRNFNQRQYYQASYDNTLNVLIETGVIQHSNVNSIVEDEAVSMAIRSHGLARPVNLSLEVDRSSVFNQPMTSNGTLDSFGLNFDPFEIHALNHDVLAQAVSTAIMKKGLGAIDR